MFIFAFVQYPNTICRINGYEEDAFTYIPIVIVGAGESGIAMGCRLKEKLGFDQFRIFDRQAGPGEDDTTAAGTRPSSDLSLRQAAPGGSTGKAPAELV